MMNISIQRLLQVIGIALLTLLVMLIYFVNEIIVQSHALSILQEERYKTRLVADVLRQSSDDLTRFARQYVVTSDEEYKNNYNRILYIRNGELPLPKNYQNIYWDLLEPKRTQLHPNSRKMSLENTFKSLPFSEYERDKLNKARRNSDELVSLEVEAFNALKGLYKDIKGNYTVYGEPDQKKAIELLYNIDYLRAKEKIMLPIDEFLDHLDKRTYEDILEHKNKIEIIKTILLMLSIFLLGVFIISAFIIKKKILAPIIFLTKAIHEFRLKNDVEKKTYYEDEIGILIDEFFSTKYEIKKDMKLLSKTKRDMEEYLKLVDQNIITSTTDLNGKIIYVSEALSQISGYKKEHLIGKNHRVLRHPDMPDELFKELWETIANNKKWEGEIKNRTKDGGSYWVEATIYPNYDENGEKTSYTAISIDITAKKQVEKLLKQANISEKKIQQYIDLVDKNILTSSTDLNGNITYVSDAFSQISGYSKDELLGKNHRIVKHKDNDPYIYENMWETLSNNRIWHGVIKNRKKDGGYYWVDATIYPMFNEVGEKIGYTAIRIDITDKKKVEELLIKDALTNIYNRGYFNEMMPKAINLAKRDRKFFSFAIMDIDYFKQYNDTYGHQEGDDVLIKVASAIQNSLQRASDMCFRLGGEEFGVIFESLEPHEAYEFANNIRKNIEDMHIEHSGSSVSSYVTASLGVVTKKTVEQLDPDKLYKEADNLLYEAKKNGRNRVEANK